MTALDPPFDDGAPPRSPWLMTLADLALLLAGFFVLVQASQSLDRKALAQGIREGFGGHGPAMADPMAVSAAALPDFAAGSAVLPAAPAALIAWARETTRDPRVTLRITGGVDGSAADVDALTGSGAVLAADRARAVAAVLARAHAVPPARMTITGAADPRRRAVIVTLGFAGARP